MEFSDHKTDSGINKKTSEVKRAVKHNILGV
jgi:hypothetical protein